MEPCSQINQMPVNILEGQIRECFGRVVYSHKTHEKCADILLSRLAKIKLAQIMLSAITTGGFVAAIVGAGYFGTVTGVVFSTALLALNAYVKNYDLGEIAQKHKQAASELWLIREKYLSLLTDLRIGDVTIESLQRRRDVLTNELYAVYSACPSTTSSAYRKAQKSLKYNEEMTFSDSEIDSFLPSEQKKT